ncbi:hypothetical protein PHYSODRAFT_523978 [Phytophthora sojae]|uniref:START domain-containing protein n=1 Tax=Phytophthora sojae (strain P6497) TaxID=1094619 RepID=G5A4Q3_PHYSP|nr:hypothetical protein PHYSODRAFT_523978 [Phytophthora sojae]EGZ09653.1 hypothetical protein PHYSODRAFT_523978 [Phytophthora sojae]|eukprot:XP_009534514.1 hypothetical protein PHYSODRAFT_523978 [Phytophthora sojae]
MELSLDDQEHCRDLTTQLLDRTLYEYEELGLDSVAHSDLNSRRWKKLQSHPDVTLYADRSPGSAWLSVMSRGDWEQPVAVTTVGEIKSSLDDVLLALVSPNLATIKLRGVLMGRKPETNLKLMSIVTPTQASPFEFLGVAQFVNTQHWPLTMFVDPREMVLALATGEVVTASGRRFGYEIILSVPLFKNSFMTRTQVVETRVFWEQPDGSVGMYSKLIVDIRARLPESVKLAMLCRGVVRFWKFIPCSVETKKLRWCLKRRKALVRDIQRQAQVTGPVKCGGCAISTLKLQDKKRNANRCELCEAWLCSKSSCRSTCQITAVVRNESNICQKDLAVCPRCMVLVREQSAANVARSELLI